MAREKHESLCHDRVTVSCETHPLKSPRFFPVLLKNRILNCLKTRFIETIP